MQVTPPMGSIAEAEMPIGIISAASLPAVKNFPEIDGDIADIVDRVPDQGFFVGHGQRIGSPIKPQARE